MRRSKTGRKIGLLLVILVASLVVVVAAQNSLSRQTIIEAGSLQTESSYILFVDASTYYVRNATTGEIEFSGTNATTVIQNAIDALSFYGKVFFTDGVYPLGLAGLTLKRGISLEGESTTWVAGRGAEITYSGSGIALSGENLDFIKIRCLKIYLTSTTQGEGCLELGDGTVYAMVSEVIFRGSNNSISGQYGVRFESGTYGTYYNTVEDCVFRGLNKGAITGNTSTSRSNQQKFVNNFFYEIGDSCFDFTEDESHENTIIGGGFAYSANAVGLKINSDHNLVVGMVFEGGSGSQSWQLGTSSDHNYFRVQDDCPTASTDLGTDNDVRDIGTVYDNAGTATNSINGTWVPHGLSGDPGTTGSITLSLRGPSQYNATFILRVPTVLSSNSTHFQIEFNAWETGGWTQVPVTAVENQTVYWDAAYRP